MNLVKKFFVFALMLTTVVTVSVGGAFQVKAAGNYSAGSLLALQGATDASVYYIGSDGMKYVFPDAKTYFTWYENFDGVVRVSVSELDMYPDGGTVTYRPGTKLITHINTAKVYAVEPGGVVRWITSEADAIALFGANWAARVQDVIPGYFSSSYTAGADMGSTLPTGSLVIEPGGSTYYYIDNGTKRPFASADAFEANNFRYEFVLTMSLGGYATGESITGEEAELSSYMPGEGNGNVVPAGGLTVALSSSTPAYNSPSLCGSDGVLYSKYNFTASQGDVVVTGMKVKRSSLGSYRDFDRIWVVADGIRRGATKSMNSADESNLVFTSDAQKITVANGTTKSVEVWASLPDSSGTACFSGDYNALGIEAVTTASTVNGLPSYGNALAVLTASAPDATVVHGTIGDTVEIGDTAVEVAKFKITNGESNETLVFKGINLKSIATSGTKVDNDDLGNFRLMDGDNNVLAGPISMSSDGYVRFMLTNSFTIPAGTNEFEWFTVTADVFDGPDRYVKLDIEEPSDVSAYGGTNMFHSDVSIAGYTAQQTHVANAELVVAVDNNLNPDARDVLENTTITLLNAKFTAGSGPVSATGMTVLLEGADMDLDDPQEFDNLRVYVNNLLVSEASGTELGNTDGDTTQSIVFTDDFSIEGVVPVRVEIDVEDLQGTTLTTIRATIVSLEGTTRDSDGTTIDENGTAVGNYATVRVPSYTIYRSATPVGVSKVLGSEDVDFLGMDIKSNITTPITVNKLKIRLVAYDGAVVPGSEFVADQNDVTNIRLVDVNGNVIAGPRSLNSSEETEFTGLNLSATSNGVKVIVRADISSSITDADVVYDTDGLYFEVVSSEGTANNNTYAAVDSDGDTIDGTANDNVNITSGLIKITLSSTGVLTATLSNDTPVSAQLLAGSTNNVIAQYKLVAEKEAIQIRKFRVGLTTGPAGEDEIARIGLYDGTTLLAQTYSFNGGYTEFDITSQNYMVQPGTSNAKYLTVKVDLTSTNDTVLDSGATVAAVLIDLEAWGSVNEVAPKSGATADGFAFVDSAKNLNEAGFDASETDLTIETGSGVLAGDIIRLESEQMYVTAWDTGDTVATVVRGFNGTTAAAHANATDVYVARSIEANNFKAYGNKIAVTNGSLSGGTLAAWSTYTSVFKVRITPATGATEEAVLNSMVVSLGLASGIAASTSNGWYISDMALYNGNNTLIGENTGVTFNMEDASDTATFSALAEPIAANGEDFTIKVKVGTFGTGIETNDALALAIANFGTISSAGDIDWDDSVSAAITWVDMVNVTQLVGPTFDR